MHNLRIPRDCRLWGFTLCQMEHIKFLKFLGYIYFTLIKYNCQLYLCATDIFDHCIHFPSLIPHTFAYISFPHSGKTNLVNIIIHICSRQHFCHHRHYAITYFRHLLFYWVLPPCVIIRDDIIRIKSLCQFKFWLCF